MPHSMTGLGERETDLKFLYDKFYDPKYGFPWPTSAI